MGVFDQFGGSEEETQEAEGSKSVFARFEKPEPSLPDRAKTFLGINSKPETVKPDESFGITTEGEPAKPQVWEQPQEPVKLGGNGKGRTLTVSRDTVAPPVEAAPPAPETPAPEVFPSPVQWQAQRLLTLPRESVTAEPAPREKAPEAPQVPPVSGLSPDLALPPVQQPPLGPLGRASRHMTVRPIGAPPEEAQMNEFPARPAPRRTMLSREEIEPFLTDPQRRAVEVAKKGMAFQNLMMNLQGFGEEADRERVVAEALAPSHGTKEVPELAAGHLPAGTEAGLGGFRNFTRAMSSSYNRGLASGAKVVDRIANTVIGQFGLPLEQGTQLYDAIVNNLNAEDLKSDKTLSKKLGDIVGSTLAGITEFMPVAAGAAAVGVPATIGTAATAGTLALLHAFGEGAGPGEQAMAFGKGAAQGQILHAAGAMKPLPAAAATGLGVLATDLPDVLSGKMSVEDAITNAATMAGLQVIPSPGLAARGLKKLGQEAKTRVLNPAIRKATIEETTQVKPAGTVTIPAEKIMNGLKFEKGLAGELTPEEYSFFQDLGLKAKDLREAAKKGLSIEVPETTITTIKDRPYWEKVKGIFGYEPTEPKVTVTGGGKAKKVGPAPTRGAPAERAMTLDELNAEPNKANYVIRRPQIHDEAVIARAKQIKAEQKYLELDKEFVGLRDKAARGKGLSESEQARYDKLQVEVPQWMERAGLSQPVKPLSEVSGRKAKTEAVPAKPRNTEEARVKGESLTREEAIATWEEYKRKIAEPAPEDLQKGSDLAFEHQLLRETVEGHLGAKPDQSFTPAEIEQKLGLAKAAEEGGAIDFKKVKLGDKLIYGDKTGTVVGRAFDENNAPSIRLDIGGKVVGVKKPAELAKLKLAPAEEPPTLTPAGTTRGVPEQAEEKAPAIETGTPVKVNGKEGVVNEVNGDGTVSVGFKNGAVEDVKAGEVEPTETTQKPKKEYNIPSLGTTGREIYQGLLSASKDVPPRARFRARVLGVADFDFRNDKLVVLEDKGRTYRPATNDEINEFHRAIDNGTVQAEYVSTTGGTISNWTRKESPEDYKLIHQATGKPLSEVSKEGVESQPAIEEVSEPPKGAYEQNIGIAKALEANLGRSFPNVPTREQFNERWKQMVKPGRGATPSNVMSELYQELNPVKSESQPIANKEPWEMTKEEFMSSLNRPEEKSKPFSIKASDIERPYGATEIQFKPVRVKDSPVAWVKPIARNIKTGKEWHPSSADIGEVVGKPFYQNETNRLGYRRLKDWLSGKLLTEDAATTVYRNDELRPVHYRHVQQALSEGKPVPEAVLKDYPDLAKEPITSPAETPELSKTEKWLKQREDTIKASKAAGNKHLDDIPPAVEFLRGKKIYNVHDPKEHGEVVTVSNRQDVVVKWADKYSEDKNSTGLQDIVNKKGKVIGHESWLMPTDRQDYVVVNPPKVYEGSEKPLEVSPESLKPEETKPLQPIASEGTIEGMAKKGAGETPAGTTPRPEGRPVDFSKDEAWNDIAYGEAKPEAVTRLKKWLKDNPDTVVRMYHGTNASIPVETEGLKPTSAKTAKSLQSRHGVVSLSIYPGMAKQFGEMVYPGKEIAIYAVDVPVSRLLPDADQLKNMRYWGEKKGLGNSLAESIAYGHGAQLKGKIPQYPLRGSLERVDEQGNPFSEKGAGEPTEKAPVKPEGGKRTDGLFEGTPEGNIVPLSHTGISHANSAYFPMAESLDGELFYHSGNENSVTINHPEKYGLKANTTNEKYTVEVRDAGDILPPSLALKVKQFRKDIFDLEMERKNNPPHLADQEQPITRPEGAILKVRIPNAAPAGGGVEGYLGRNGKVFVDGEWYSPTDIAYWGPPNYPNKRVLYRHPHEGVISIHKKNEGKPERIQEILFAMKGIDKTIPYDGTATSARYRNVPENLKLTVRNLESDGLTNPNLKQLENYFLDRDLDNYYAFRFNQGSYLHLSTEPRQLSPKERAALKEWEQAGGNLGRTALVSLERGEESKAWGYESPKGPEKKIRIAKKEEPLPNLTPPPSEGGVQGKVPPPKEAPTETTEPGQKPGFLLGEKAPKTSEEAQKAVDDKIDELMGKGMSFEDASNHPETEALFKIRDEIDKKDLGDWRQVALKDTGLPEKEAKAAFESIGFGDTRPGEVYMTAKGLKEFSQDTLINLKGLYNHFTDGKKDRTLAEFRWGGTADEPKLQGTVIDEGGMPSEWDETALKKAEAVYNAIAKTQSLEPINLSRIPKEVSHAVNAGEIQKSSQPKYSGTPPVLPEKGVDRDLKTGGHEGRPSPSGGNRLPETEGGKVDLSSFSNFVKSKGEKWPMGSGHPRWKELKEEFDRLKAEKAPEPGPAAGNRWLRNPDSNKTELYFTKADFDKLPDGIRTDVKRYFLWSRGKKAWISKAKGDNFTVKEILRRLENQGIFKKEEAQLTPEQEVAKTFQEGGRGAVLPEQKKYPDLTVTGQTKQLEGRPGATYVVHHRKPVLGDGHVFRVIIQKHADGFISEDGTGETREQAYDNALANYDRKIAERKKPAEVTKETEIPSTPSSTVATWVKDQLSKGETIDKPTLMKQAAEAYGGTISEGKYNAKDAFDALEMGINQYIVKKEGEYDPGTIISTTGAAQDVIDGIRKDIMDKIPSQSGIRTPEQDEFQQFSTPPDLAFTMAWVGNISSKDTVLEPSAGVGGLASFAKAAGAKTIVNELSSRRADLLKQMGFDQVFTENAEQINNILQRDVKPTVVLMNPPFSSTAGRIKGERKSANVIKHLDQAFKRLEEGGRMVALIGKGWFEDPKAITDYLKNLVDKNNLSANIVVGGKGYAKYGTTYDNRILVIDKTPPTGKPTVTGTVEDVKDAIPLLQEVRDARTPPEPRQIKPEVQAVSGRPESGTRPEPTVLPPTDVVGVGERETGGVQRQPVEKHPGEPSRGQPSGGLPIPETGGGRGTLPAGGQPGQPEDTGGAGGRTPGQSGLETERPSEGLSQSESARVTLEETKEEENPTDITDSLYENYKPKKALVSGAKPHPGPIVESAAMASVDPPNVKYRPNLPANAIDTGKYSNVQLESIVYAGQAHSVILPSGERQGYFIGDGTGVGKGREIVGIIQDNWNQGRKKAIWLSQNSPLIESAQRDVELSGWNKDLVFDVGKTKIGVPIKNKEGIAFVGYDLLRSKKKGKSAEEGQAEVPEKARLNQLVEWFGKDFDGVIAFDESHNMGNAIATRGARGTKKASAKALAGIKLQEALPNARVIYVSATGATEVMNFAYAKRLGLWGQGTAFADAPDFINKVSAGGMAAMELVARDLKSMGKYTARSLSYEGVKYARMEHALSPEQREIYDALAESWQIVLQNIHKALEAIGVTQINPRTDRPQTLNSRAKSAAMSAFWGSHQRFFNQVITAMQMPTVIKNIEKDLEKGNAVVLQLVNTNEAATTRALSRMEEEDELEDLDLTPREQLMEFIQHSFPVNQYQQIEDQNGNITSELVVDSAGNAVENAEAVAMREELLNRLGAIKVPDNPLDMIINHFGVDKVAEISGRTRRVIEVTDKKGTHRVIDKRSKSKTMVDANAFMDDKKQVLAFTYAGGTGASYHADLTRKNQRPRMHYLVQPGWRADRAVQGLGRTHRTNQAQPPEYYLVTTDLKGQKRFISSIARRLDQLGALTKGQRQTGGQGLFSERDNLESQYASDAVFALVQDIARGNVEGMALGEFSQQLGINLIDSTGQLNESNIPEVPQFLNRLLSMKIDMQDKVFTLFSDKLDIEIAKAIQNGTLDVGLETVKAKKIEKIGEQVIHTDEKTGAETKFVELELTKDARLIPWEKTDRFAKGGYVQNIKSGRVWALSEPKLKTNSYSGDVTESFTATGMNYGVHSIEGEDINDPEKYLKLSKGQAKSLWNSEYEAAPKEVKERNHLVTGALLPIYNRLPEGNARIVRLQTDKGERMIGRLIPARDLEGTKQRLGAETSAIKMTPKEILDHVFHEGYSIELANTWSIVRRRTEGEDRIEIKGPEYREAQLLLSYGVEQERVHWETRYFIPNSEKGVEAIEKILDNNPIIKATPGTKSAEDIVAHGRNVLKDQTGAVALDLLAPGFKQVAKATSDLFEAYKRPPEWTDSKKIIGEYTGAMQVIDFNLTKFGKELNAKIPRSRQEAITNYMQAGGDMDLLQERAQNAKPRYKKGYEDALNLTPEEKKWAESFRDRSDAVWEMAHKAGVIDDYIENYVRGEWERQNPITKKILSQVNAGVFQTHPREAKHKIFQSYFEGEQAGYAPKDKRIAYQLVAGERSIMQAIEARKALKALMKSVEPDGRPTVVVGGAGSHVTDKEETGAEAYYVKPNAKKHNTNDYKYLDHPALRRWKWIDNDPDGKPILMQGNMWIHPDAFGRINALLGKSKVKTYEIPEKVPILGGTHPGEFALRTGAFIKGTILLGPFHQFHVGEHAVFHRVMPFRLPEIDFEKRPILREGVDHGLMLFNHRAVEEFGEGLASGGLFHKIPGVGSLLRKYQDWLFSQYIPELKAAMFEHAVKRAEKYYEKQLASGKFTRDQLLDNAAKQANAAFGEQNYRYIGRNPTLQDALRIGLLAPDFLEARLKFAGQALRPHGREQATALVLGGIIMAATAQIVNMMFGDEKKPHWSRPFTIIIGGREYTPRSVVGDIMHLITDPRSFWYHRLNPLWGRPLLEISTGRDYYGRKVGSTKAAEDILKSWVPIPGQGFVKKEVGKTIVQSVRDTILTSVGMSNYEYRSDFIKYAQGIDKPVFMPTEKSKLKREFEEQIRHNQPDVKTKIREAIKEGKLSREDKVTIEREAKKGPAAMAAEHMTLDELAKGIPQATPEEKKALKPIFRRKLSDAKNLPGETRAQYRGILIGM